MGTALYTLHTQVNRGLKQSYCLYFTYTKSEAQRGCDKLFNSHVASHGEDGAQMQERPVLSHHHHKLNSWGWREPKWDGCEDSLGASDELKGTRPQGRVRRGPDWSWEEGTRALRRNELKESRRVSRGSNVKWETRISVAWKTRGLETKVRGDEIKGPCCCDLPPLPRCVYGPPTLSSFLPGSSEVRPRPWFQAQPTPITLVPSTHVQTAGLLSSRQLQPHCRKALWARRQSQWGKSARDARAGHTAVKGRVIVKRAAFMTVPLPPGGWRGGERGGDLKEGGAPRGKTQGTDVLRASHVLGGEGVVSQVLSRSYQWRRHFYPLLIIISQKRKVRHRIAVSSIISTNCEWLLRA